MEKINLWDEAPNYNPKYDNEHNEGCPSLDCYLVDTDEPRPAFLICPGGGYDHRAEHEGGLIATELNGFGVNAFVLNYRVKPYSHPVMLNDAQRAMRYIRYNSERFNVVPDRIGAMGFSAGGHLALMLSEHYADYDYKHKDEMDEVSARPDALCLCYPVVSCVSSVMHERTAENLCGDNKELRVQLSGELNVNHTMPPVFVWHTMEDASVNCINSIELVKSLKHNNVPVEYHLFTFGRHGLGLATGTKGTEQWFWLFINWLKVNGFGI